MEYVVIIWQLIVTLVEIENLVLFFLALCTSYKLLEFIISTKESTDFIIPGHESWD